jgi:uncharacterized RDD family membrane protein YckC
MANCKNCGAELPEAAQFCPKCGTAVSSGAATNEPERQPPQVLAFWGERFLAWLIDVVIVGAITFFLGIFGLSFAAISFWPSWIPFLNFGPGGLLLFAYWTVMEGMYGQSFGKMIMRLRVTSLNGQRSNVVNAAIESFGKAFFLPIDLIIGWLVSPKKRQRIFNYLSNTIVAKVT